MPLLHYQKSNIYQGVKIAAELGVDRAFAVNARRRYLMEELERVELEMAWYDDFEGAVDSEYFALCQYAFLGEEKAKILAELRTIKTVNMPKKGITDEDIEAARNVPVSSLIEFNHGKAKAFCHEDNNPSMFHGTKTNQAVCPVCDKYFDSIAVLMERDGMSFVDAVNQLSRR